MTTQPAIPQEQDKELRELVELIWNKNWDCGEPARKDIWLRSVTALLTSEIRKARLAEAEWWQEYMDVNRGYRSAIDDPGPMRLSELRKP